MPSLYVTLIIIGGKVEGVAASAAHLTTETDCALGTKSSRRQPLHHLLLEPIMKSWWSLLRNGLVWSPLAKFHLNRWNSTKDLWPPSEEDTELIGKQIAATKLLMNNLLITQFAIEPMRWHLQCHISALTTVNTLWVAVTAITNLCQRTTLSFWHQRVWDHSVFYRTNVLTHKLQLFTSANNNLFKNWPRISVNDPVRSLPSNILFIIKSKMLVGRFWAE